MTQSNITFSLFTNVKGTSDKSPEMTGRLEIPVELLDQFIADLVEQEPREWNGRKTKTLDLACWARDKGILKYGGTAKVHQPYVKPETETEQPELDISSTEEPAKAKK